MKKLFATLLSIMLIIGAFPIAAFANTAQETYSEEYRRLLTGEGELEILSIAPKTQAQKEALVHYNASQQIDQYFYEIIIEDETGAYDSSSVTMTLRAKDGSKSETHKIKLKYQEPPKAYVDMAKEMAKQLKKYPSNTVEDLTLVNAVNNSEYLSLSEFRASDFYYDISENIRKAEEATPLSITFEPRNGKDNLDAGPSVASSFVETKSGDIFINHMGYICEIIPLAEFDNKLYKKNIIYVPENSTDYVKAARDRLAKYMGEMKFSFELGGKLSDLNCGDLDVSKLADDNYYKLTIRNRTHNVLLYKMPESALVQPKARKVDTESGVIFESEDASVMLNGVFGVYAEANKYPGGSFGNDKHISYTTSIPFYSEYGEEHRTVDATYWLPIPEELKGKDIKVTYGNPHVHYPFTIENGYAVVSRKGDSMNEFVISLDKVTPEPSYTWNVNCPTPKNPEEMSRLLTDLIQNEIDHKTQRAIVRAFSSKYFDPNYAVVTLGSTHGVGNEKYYTVRMVYSDSYTEGWHEIEGKWYYFDANGNFKTGWQQVGKSWYYMDASGVMQTGWQKIGGSWYYLGKYGNMATGWLKLGDKHYYMDASGVMQTGWINEGVFWYYMDASGVMQTGWQKIGSSWYYLGKYGNMATGWLKLGNTYYYLHSSGAMATGWVNDGGIWYYMNSSGAMATGWVNVGGTWYYMDASGVMQTGWLNLGGNWYYLHGSGAMATGWLKIGSSWYYMNSSGVMQTGWQKIDGTWYYFYASGVMR